MGGKGAAVEAFRGVEQELYRDGEAVASMWQAAQHGKIERVLGQHSADAPAAWRAVVDRSEDLLTSSVFERLGYLGGPLPVELLLRAAESAQMPWIPVPLEVREVRAWPSLLLGEGQVEPDWVLVTDEYAVVVEAKWGRGVVPTHAQLRDQHEAARRELPSGRVFHVALVQSGDATFPAGVPGVVVRWARLRLEVLRALRSARSPGEHRVLSDIRAVLDRRGLATVFLDTLPAMRVEGHIEALTLRARPPRALPSLPETTIPTEAHLPPWS